MRAHIAVALIGLMACSGATVAPSATDEPWPPGWAPALPSAAGGSVVPTGDWAVVVTPTGVASVPEGRECAGGRLAGDAIVAIATGLPAPFPKSARVQAATVERAATRLAEVMGPYEGLLPGGSADKDPALYQGIRVRTVRKTRRDNAAPVHVVLGDRRGRIALAIVDSGAMRVLASHTLELGDAAGATPGVTPVADLDGDGQLEVVVWADTPTTGVRALYRVTLDPPALELVGRSDGAASCAP